MAKNFSAQIDDWIRKSETLTMAVVQQATQEVIKEAQTPRAKSGRMPVDTGALINSAVATLNKQPARSKPTGSELSTERWLGEETAISVLLKAKPGDTIYFGWVMEYARVMEQRYSFLGMATQKWQQRVNAAARQLKQRAGR